MASLATIAVDRGDEVSGSDAEKYILVQQSLEERHVPATSFLADNVHEGDTVIIGDAFNEPNPKVKGTLATDTVKTYWCHEFLGSLAKEYTSISVAGTHGKATTTGVPSRVMSLAAPIGYLISDETGEMPKDSRYFVLESYEYQRRFLAYRPEYIIITNIELDHVNYHKDIEDYYDAFGAFANQIQKGVVLFGDDMTVHSLHVKIEHLYHGPKDHNDMWAVYVRQHEGGMWFGMLCRKKLFAYLDLSFVGKPLLWDSLGTITIGIMEGLSGGLLQEGLQGLPGVKRGFVIEEDGGNVYICLLHAPPSPRDFFFWSS